MRTRTQRTHTKRTTKKAWLHEMTSELGIWATTTRKHEKKTNQFHQIIWKCKMLPWWALTLDRLQTIQCETNLFVGTVWAYNQSCFNPTTLQSAQHWTIPNVRATLWLPCLRKANGWHHPTFRSLIWLMFDQLSPAAMTTHHQSRHNCNEQQAPTTYERKHEKIIPFSLNNLKRVNFALVGPHAGSFANDSMWDEFVRCHKVSPQQKTWPNPHQTPSATMPTHHQLLQQLQQTTNSRKYTNTMGFIIRGQRSKNLMTTQNNSLKHMFRILNIQSPKM